MTNNERKIRQVRIDVPLRTTSAYLYVDPTMSDWGQWWVTLYTYLLSLAPAQLNWVYEPVQDIYAAQLNLTDDQRADVVRHLRTASGEQIASHRTLRRAVELTHEQERRIDVVYFSAGKKEHEPYRP